MRPAPLEEDDRLPYVLPPGPYTTAKPELSYAAIIGQAILASPGHALALQDIYEFITTVYPYYRRGEPTWMNSVRHALSTMAVFRKVQRERSEGKSLWAVWERDLPCFEGGGFKKSLCTDMNTSTTSSRASKKRGAEDGGTSRPKRRKAAEEPTEEDQRPLPALTPVLVQPPYFPHITPYHQPYYQTACVQQQLPTDVLFPPLPPSSNYHRVIARAVSTPVVKDVTPRAPEAMEASDGADTADEGLPPSSPIERPPSSSSIPELMSSLSDSSSPAPSSHLSAGAGSSRGPSPVVVSTSLNIDGPIEDPEATWLQSNVAAPRSSAVIPQSIKKGKGKARVNGSTVKKRLQTMPSLPPPPSPTLERRAAAGTRYGVRSPKNPVKASTGKRSPGKSTLAKARVSHVGARPVTPPPMTASIEEIMRAMEQHAASGQITRSVSPLSEFEVATMVMSSATCSDAEDIEERPSSPDLPPPSSLPSTPPQRLADLEAELFNFSPFKSPLMMRPISRHGPSPTMTDDSHNLVASLHAPLAPYLRTDDAEGLNGESGPSIQRSPRAIPRTPKKTPPQRPTPSGYRPDSPFGTPSRGTRGSFDDDLASFFQSPGGSSLFDPFLPGLSKSPVLYGLQSPGFGAQY
ncbi:hypothetical protein C8Q79DRAFT_929179 [Trametes meyenii]|nr:hypothetical protein C8Q79DRAFT_929179 [Trametes meyenii]